MTPLVVISSSCEGGIYGTHKYQSLTMIVQYWKNYVAWITYYQDTYMNVET